MSCSCSANGKTAGGQVELAGQGPRDAVHTRHDLGGQIGQHRHGVDERAVQITKARPRADPGTPRDVVVSVRKFEPPGEWL